MYPRRFRDLARLRRAARRARRNTGPTTSNHPAFGGTDQMPQYALADGAGKPEVRPKRGGDDVLRRQLSLSA